MGAGELRGASLDQERLWQTCGCEHLWLETSKQIKLVTQRDPCREAVGVADTHVVIFCLLTSLYLLLLLLLP